jgi:hypothetical protein
LSSILEVAQHVSIALTALLLLFALLTYAKQMGT